MNLIELQLKADEIAEMYGYPRPIIKLSSRLKRTHGTCDYFTRIITLSTVYCEIETDEVIINLLKHEIAHLKHPNHGPDFKRACMYMGCDNDKPSSRSEKYAEYLFNTSKVKYSCPNGHHAGATKPYKVERSCGKCSPTFDRRFLLKLVE